MLRNEGNLHERFPFRGKGWQLIIFATLIIATIVFLSTAISITGYAYWMRHYSDEGQFRRRLIQLADLTDSVQGDLLAHQHYLRSLRAVFGGHTSYLRESIPYEDTVESSLSAPYTYSLDSLSFFSSTDRSKQLSFSEVTSTYNRTLLSIELLFFPPIKGYISDKYAEHEAHYGIDLLAPKGTVVQATATGVVVFASWTQDGGYVIALQHAEGFVSFYKHNSELLKQVGETVYISDPIAVIGNTGSLSTGPHLHFELWQDGKPIDPEQLISF